MGESKRRKSQLGEAYGQSERIVSWLPLTKDQSATFMKITSRATWVGIGLVVTFWLTLRFIGPNLGWWTLSD
jgi:Protein of unknown function (DUF2839)